ncbi:hypothetical protein [Gloeobacter morelensis]|uniref:Uncharacterized protein n=1 Tax=Gloeobacter morelensis MG652769 TaxID=2781736 RepID=A0ABY3PLS3_9CYAN|nr:hypothetical protein [Gloeobacter morelensis]UFP94602.1 hypothetical protein ISF26_23195 [Gloeobacter morelensis MG652769]
MAFRVVKFKKYSDSGERARIRRADIDIVIENECSELDECQEKASLTLMPDDRLESRGDRTRLRERNNGNLKTMTLLRKSDGGGSVVKVEGNVVLLSGSILLRTDSIPFEFFSSIDERLLPGRTTVELFRTCPVKNSGTLFAITTENLRTFNENINSNDTTEFSNREAIPKGYRLEAEGYDEYFNISGTVEIFDMNLNCPLADPGFMQNSCLVSEGHRRKIEYKVYVKGQDFRVCHRCLDEERFDPDEIKKVLDDAEF